MADGKVGSGDGPDDKHYELNSDDYIWSVLTECNDAAFVEDDKWMVHDREYLSFTITSEVLGVYRVAMYVTEDGYLWTNAFSYQYLFKHRRRCRWQDHQVHKGKLH